MNNRYSERWWKDYEKEWLMERWGQEIKGEDMKQLRRLYWHLSEDSGLFLWTIAILLASTLVWILADYVLGLAR